MRIFFVFIRVRWKEVEVEVESSLCEDLNVIVQVSLREILMGFLEIFRRHVIVFLSRLRLTRIFQFCIQSYINYLQVFMVTVSLHATL